MTLFCVYFARFMQRLPSKCSTVNYSAAFVLPGCFFTIDCLNSVDEPLLNSTWYPLFLIRIQETCVSIEVVIERFAVCVVLLCERCVGSWMVLWCPMFFIDRFLHLCICYLFFSFSLFQSCVTFWESDEFDSETHTDNLLLTVGV